MSFGRKLKVGQWERKKQKRGHIMGKLVKGVTYM
jgi:hypothetical protein